MAAQVKQGAYSSREAEEDNVAFHRRDTSANPFNDELATGLAALAARFERV